MRLFALAFLVAAGLAGPAVALEKFVAAENLSLRLGSSELRIPRIALEESLLTSQELAALFTEGATPSLPERLARFSAQRARIPEARGESLAGETKKEFLYKDILLENVVSGRVGALRVATLEESLRDKGQSVTARYENLTASGLELTQLAPLLSRRRAGDGEPAQPLADSAALDKLAVWSSDGAFLLTAARLSTHRPRLGALSESTLHRLAGETGAPQDDAEIVKDLIAAVAFASVEAHDLSLAGRGAPADDPFFIGARDVVFEGLEAGVARKAQLGGFTLNSADGGRITLDALAFEGLDLGSALTRSGARALHFDKGRLEKLTGDAPAPDGQGRTKFTLDSAAVDLAHFHDGAPTKAAARFQGLAVDLAARGDEANAKLLRALGYSRLELSGGAEAEWREANREFEVSKLSLDAKGMFALNLDLKLSGVSGAIFTANPLVAASLLLAARVDRVEATLANGELFDRLIERTARQSGADPAQLRAEYARDMGKTVLAALGESDKAKRIATAVERYLIHPQRLRIALTAPQGLGAVDLLKSLPEILQEMEVEAAAE